MQDMRMTKTITATLAVMVVAPQKKITTKRKKNPSAPRAAAVEMTTKIREAEQKAAAQLLHLQVPAALAAVAEAKNPAAPKRSPAEAKAVLRRRAPAAAVVAAEAKRPAAAK